MEMGIEKIREQVIKEIGGGKFDPFADPKSWNLIEKKIPEDCWSLLLDRSGATVFVEQLPNIFKPEKFGVDKEAQVTWERIGNFYKNLRRYHEALQIYSSLYQHLLSAQQLTVKRFHKGAPLVWMSDCFSRMGFPVLSKRYLMLTLCEDAIRDQGFILPSETGTYFRLVWSGALTDKELNDYATLIYQLSKANPKDSFFPEWLLQQIDKHWMTEIPSPAEANAYWTNILYVKLLISKLGDKTGNVLESLAEYLLSCMPGCRTTIRKTTVSSEIDIVCSIDGIEADFRSELGRYFVCECKDWKKAVGFTNIAKFCRILDSVKSRFGIIFSPKGISGQISSRYAGNEPQKLFQNNGIVLVVIDMEDLAYVADGGNFINLLRNKYEKVRLDLK
jgi:hypothetical protein